MPVTREKSEQTLAAIVSAAMEIAVVQGLHTVSLAGVAKRLNISKSGVFMRVGSLESLQYLVLEEYERLFAEHVFLPALREPRGVPRLDAIVRLWIGRGSARNPMAGALHASAAFDLVAAETPLGERLRESVTRWRTVLVRTVRQALAEGHLRPDTDPWQLVYEINSLMIGYLHDGRFIRDPQVRERVTAAYLRLMSTYRSFQLHG
ncbi:TetR/AcrR family transcriptional regulator [Caldimonas brevitalea]|uniref:TetR family transcriptional regulator n=1 Tax=Caldimonas brevitalea TaxID=413882 RepID=A0A0G3BS52_9BURK|nr:TetR/AcrR family transcriptional regulator [Caldimonas brevitalea]AKJ30241.1 TetR family transcriptional regulator [Caldimonas brevitalea]